jgi:hypothetical protein
MLSQGPFGFAGRLLRVGLFHQEVLADVFCAVDKAFSLFHVFESRYGASEDGRRAKIIGFPGTVVELINLFGRQVGIIVSSAQMARFRYAVFFSEESHFPQVTIEHSSFISGSYGKLNRVGTQFQGIFEGLTHGAQSFTRKTEYETSVNPQSHFPAACHELLCLPGIYALFDPLEYLVISGFKAYHKISRPCLFHPGQDFNGQVVAAAARPCNTLALQSIAKLQYTISFAGERVVLDLNFFYLRECIVNPDHFRCHIGYAAFTVAMARYCLGPQAVRTMTRTAPTGKDGYIGIVQVRDSIA